MPEQKKRGFHALEERIHQIEEDDAKAAREATAKPGEAARTTPERPAAPKPERR